MPEIIRCTACGRQLQLPESLLGQSVQCPLCKTTFVASTGRAAAPQPPSAPGYPAPPGPPRWSRDDFGRQDRDHGDDYDDYYDRRYPPRRRYDVRPHRSGAVLTLGILSLVFSLCPLVGFTLGLIALILGSTDVAAIDNGEMDPEGRGSTVAGRTCGLIGLILSAVFFVLACMIRLSEGFRGFR
jgi:hypothetical protein